MKAARMNAAEIFFIVIAGIFGVPMMYAVHLGLSYCCLRYAQRFCKQHGYAVSRWRRGTAFDQSGTKTEFMLVELDCLDAQRQRKLIRLMVWLFGIRKVLYDDAYPESHDEQWPL